MQCCLPVTRFAKPRPFIRGVVLAGRTELARMDALGSAISTGTLRQLQQLEERIDFESREREEFVQKLIKLQETKRKGFHLLAHVNTIFLSRHKKCCSNAVSTVADLRETKELLQRKLRHVPTVPARFVTCEEGQSLN